MIRVRRPNADMGDVPKTSDEHDHLDKESKGRNGVPGRVSEPEGFGSRDVRRISESGKSTVRSLTFRNRYVLLH